MSSSSEPTQYDWFAVLGTSISDEQRSAGINEAQEMGVDPDSDFDWVDTVAEYIELDQPKEAIDTTREHLDFTGTFRFLAVLCYPQDEHSS